MHPRDPRRRSFARIVKQDREKQDRGLPDFRKKVGIGAPPRLAPLADAIDRLHRHKGMLVNGIAVEEVADDEAFNRLQLRKDRGEHAGIVHPADAQGRVRLGEDPAEGGPYLRCGREMRAQSREPRFDLLLRLGGERGRCAGP